MTLAFLANRKSQGSNAAQFLAAQWDEARGGALMPRRAALTARRLLPILPALSIYEYRSPEEIIFRLCGTRFCQVFNMDLTGRNLIDLARGDDRRQMRIERWRSMATLPCGGIGHAAVPQPSGLSYHCDGLFLPVLPDDDQAPLQFMSVLEELGAGDPTPEIQFHMQQQVQSYPEPFDFIDIGRGVPKG